MALQSFQFVMRSGPTPEKAFTLQQDEITIGRDTSNTIVINDAEVSRKHAQLTAQTGGYIIEDLGSTNGTFVNGQRLMGPHLLSSGELVMMGENVSLVFEAAQFDPDATMVSTFSEAGSIEGDVISPPEDAAPEPESVPQAQAGYPLPPPAFESQPPLVQPPQAPQAKPLVVEPAYSGQIPPGPAEPYPLPYQPPIEEGGRSRLWIFLGCGCLVVVLCVLLGGAFGFDQMNLYCEPPFNLIFPCP